MEGEQLNSPQDEVPDELVAALVLDAAEDADRVSLFLRTVGLEASPQNPIPIPAGFLLNLSAALRLFTWETQGFFYHVDRGLPTAKDAVLCAFRSLNKFESADAEFCLSVWCLSVERFAWTGRQTLNANVALDDLIDDDALEAVAIYLWSTRHRTGG